MNFNSEYWVYLVLPPRLVANESDYLPVLLLKYSTNIIDQSSKLSLNFLNAQY